MADITTTIGSGLDYGDPALWEADLDNSGVYSSGDVAIGQMYAEVFDVDVLIDGGGTIGLTSILLQPYPGQEGDGIEGTGPRIVRSGVSAAAILEIGDCPPIIIEGLEIDGADQGADTGALHSGANTLIFRRNLIHTRKRMKNNQILLSIRQNLQVNSINALNFRIFSRIRKPFLLNPRYI